METITSLHYLVLLKASGNNNTSLHYLVLPHTHLDGEDGTGGTLLFVMAGVENVVVTGVHAGADPLAGGRPRTTG